MAVPSPLSVKLTPGGSAPASLIDAVGLPVVSSENDPCVPTVKAADPPLLMAGAAGVAGLTVRAKLCVAPGPTPFAAVIVSG